VARRRATHVGRGGSAAGRPPDDLPAVGRRTAPLSTAPRYDRRGPEGAPRDGPRPRRTAAAARGTTGAARRAGPDEGTARGGPQPGGSRARPARRAGDRLPVGTRSGAPRTGAAACPVGAAPPLTRGAGGGAQGPPTVPARGRGPPWTGCGATGAGVATSPGPPAPWDVAEHGLRMGDRPDTGSLVGAPPAGGCVGRRPGRAARGRPHAIDAPGRTERAGGNAPTSSHDAAGGSCGPWREPVQPGPLRDRTAACGPPADPGHGAGLPAPVVPRAVGRRPDTAPGAAYHPLDR
jgi:hypothetical protein